jgi:hypothetical protein
MLSMNWEMLSIILNDCEKDLFNHLLKSNIYSLIQFDVFLLFS